MNKGLGAGQRTLMTKIRNLEKDRDALLERNDIVGALTAGQNQMHQILSERSKRERTERESPEDPVLVEVQNLKYADDNHTRCNRKSNVSIEESNDRMETRAISLSTDWLETGSVMEVMEALHNWTSIRWMVAPWDWSGILLARVIHEAAFFSLVMGMEQ